MMLDLVQDVENRFYEVIQSLPETEREIEIMIHSFAMEVVMIAFETFLKSSQSVQNTPHQSQIKDQ